MKETNRKRLIVILVISLTAVLSALILLVLYFISLQCPEKESVVQKRKLTLYSSLKTSQLEKIESNSRPG